jgi:hypothetical protein
MMLHPSTFNYLLPTDAQLELMFDVRAKTTEYARALSLALPDGPDKEYILRKVRELAMWIDVTITREADGRPRD